MPTSATSAPPRHRSADRAPGSLRSCSPRGVTRLGFTLIEVLIALSIIAMVAAVAVPSLARRLDLAFSDADLQQAQASAKLLPARVATLGIELTLDAAALAKPLPHPAAGHPARLGSHGRDASPTVALGHLRSRVAGAA
jgi:prepilin-type N-terminal cleavage/methylation domain-containing protein